ncbi:hypothetical protein [Geotalea sp. SG265]|uniref:hypothetical protein n=1 Tax=Geotalea sp. SG265 TaxID=2922867 RepID=UPI001FAEAB7C|nr:hypothetical protein [Geotalea sp. SG265]
MEGEFQSRTLWVRIFTIQNKASTVVYFSFYILTALLNVYVIFLARRRFDTYINPWSFFFVSETFILQGVSIIAVLFVYTDDTSLYINKMLICASLYTFAYTISFFFSSRVIDQITYSILANLTDTRVLKNNRHIILFILLSTFFLSFGVLMLRSGAGTLWLTDPRHAYEAYRGTVNAGAFYALAQWTLMTTFFAYVWGEDTKRLFFCSIIFAFIAYFLGSKQFIIDFIVVAIISYDAFIKRLSAKILFFYMLLFSALFLFLLGKGDNNIILIAAKYFGEYSYDSMLIFPVKESKIFYLGQVFLTGFWQYVPRFLYEGKPYEFGFSLVNSVLFPGAAERGATPGMLPWTSWYLDAGYLGVFVYSFLRGLIDRAVFSQFNRFKYNTFISFFTVTYVLTPLLFFAPTLYVFIWIICVCWTTNFVLQLLYRVSRKQKSGNCKHECLLSGEGA